MALGVVWFVNLLQNIAYRFPYGTSIAMVLMVFFAVKAVVYQEPERDNRGRTALYLAAEHGDVAEVNALLVSTDTPDQRDDCLWTPLMRAAQNGHLEVARLLLEAGADVNAVDKGGYSVLMVTAGESRPELVRLLLEYQPDLDVQEPILGWTALIWAAKEGRTANVKLLLEAAANRHLQDRDGRTALDWARQIESAELSVILER